MKPTSSGLILIGAIFAFLAVAIGAFGAHAWQDILATNNTTKAFATGSQYHFIHTLALLWLGTYWHKLATGGLKRLAAYCMVIGTIVFSGSLYILALSGIKWLGAITPIGGILLLVSWACIIVLTYQSRHSTRL